MLERLALYGLLAWLAAIVLAPLAGHACESAVVVDALVQDEATFDVTVPPGCEALYVALFRRNPPHLARWADNRHWSADLIATDAPPLPSGFTLDCAQTREVQCVVAGPYPGTWTFYVRRNRGNPFARAWVQLQASETP